MIVIGIIIGILIGAAIGSAISGHVAYMDGVMDEKRKWYVHAHWHLHDEESFKEGGEE